MSEQPNVENDRTCSACHVEHDQIDWSSLGMVCGRCGQHTGNNHQGHYWGLCKVWLAEGRPWQEAMRELHFCCPGDCELKAVTTPIPPVVKRCPVDPHGRPCTGGDHHCCAIPPGDGCGAADSHQTMRDREHLAVCPICNLNLTSDIPPGEHPPT